MEKITSIVELKSAIQYFEEEQQVRFQALREQFNITYNSLKPINIIKDALGVTTSSPSTVENIIVGVLSLASGYLAKRIFVGASHNMFRKLIGLVIQFGVTSIITKNTTPIKAIGDFISEFIAKQRRKHQGE